MNLALAVRLGGWLLIALAACQVVPLLAALAFDEPVLPYLGVAASGLLLGLPAALLVRPESLRIRPRDGFVVVSGAWAVAASFGALPYVATGALGPIDALFESTSGFTTTGSTVLTDIESAPHGLLLWRSLTQWIGGMGIVVFTIALMPILGIGGMQLFKAEVPGPVTEKIRPRVAQTARALWAIYVGLTLLQWLALLLAGMGPFDALNHAFSTLSTGGFSTRNASIRSYASPAIEWIVIVFMLLGGMNFVLHYRVITGRVRDVGRDAELRYFLVVVAASIAAVTLAVGFGARDGSGSGPLRDVVFTVVSVVTTTGFSTADFELWPSFAHVVLLALMVLGSMAGSTSGGVKSLRALLAVRAVRGTFEKAGHRNAVHPPVQYGGRPVPEEVITSIWVFLAVYGLLAAAQTASVAAAGYDLDTSLSAALTSLGNVGPGLGAIGPYDHFAHFPVFVKLGLVFCMLAGRLELFTLLVLLTPGFWRR